MEKTINFANGIQENLAYNKWVLSARVAIMENKWERVVL